MSGIGVQLRTHGVLMALATEDGQSQRQLSARLGHPPQRDAVGGISPLPSPAVGAESTLGLGEERDQPGPGDRCQDGCDFGRGRYDQPDCAEQFHHADEPHGPLGDVLRPRILAGQLVLGWRTFTRPDMANKAARIACTIHKNTFIEGSPLS
jgi:hypothetical protein